MSLLLAACVIAMMAAIVVLYFKPYHYGDDDGQSAPSRKALEQADDEDDTRWRSVRIRPGLIACARAGELQGRVFASCKAPPLPLSGCDERDCRCHYLFAEDRRSGLDRRAELDRLLGGQRDDRRRSPGRRADDLVPA